MLLLRKCTLLLFSLMAIQLEAGSYAQLSSAVTQMPSKGGGSVMKMELVDAIENMDLSLEKDKVIVKEEGVYVIMIVGQVGATTPGAAGNVDIWISKNGAPLTNSGSRMTVEHSLWTGTIVSQTIAILKPGDTISTHFAATAPSLGVLFLQPPNEPAVASASFTMYKIN